MPNEDLSTATPADVLPCLYRTGRTIGAGTYAIVREAIHDVTGERFACKVINKKLMQGREYLIRNEIAILQKISSGHRNVVAMRDYFETEMNIYICFDLCTGGELFTRICNKGCYPEIQAVEIVHSVLEGIRYIHDAGVVHRDLKPENLLFRTPGDDAEVALADFGLSRVLDEGKLELFTELCGTPSYMAPEIFNKSGHGQPVDIWALGVVTYFMLAGYVPFDRATKKQEIRAIRDGDYAFKPDEYWEHVSEPAKSFITDCLTMDPNERPTAVLLLEHEWFTTPLEPIPDSFESDSSRSIRPSPPDDHSRRSATPHEHRVVREDVKKCQDESKREDMDTAPVLHRVLSQGDGVVENSPAAPSHRGRRRDRVRDSFSRALEKLKPM